MKCMQRITFSMIVSLVFYVRKGLCFVRLLFWYVVHAKDYISLDCFISIQRTLRITFYLILSLI